MDQHGVTSIFCQATVEYKMVEQMNCLRIPNGTSMLLLDNWSDAFIIHLGKLTENIQIGIPELIF